MLRPQEAKEIRFTYGTEEVTMLSRRNTIEGFLSNKSWLFLSLRIDGKLKLFNFYYTQGGGGMYNPTTGGFSPGNAYSVENYLLEKPNGELTRPRAISFRKQMLEYFKDCPALVERIKEKELRKGDLEIIVMEYNSKCAN